MTTKSNTHAVNQAIDTSALQYYIYPSDEKFELWVGDVVIHCSFYDFVDGINFVDCRAKKDKSQDDKRKFVVVENNITEQVFLCDFESLSADIKATLWSLLLNEVVVEYNKYVEDYQRDQYLDDISGV